MGIVIVALFDEPLEVVNPTAPPRLVFSHEAEDDEVARHAEQSQASYLSTQARLQKAAGFVTVGGRGWQGRKREKRVALQVLHGGVLPLVMGGERGDVGGLWRWTIPMY